MVTLLKETNALREPIYQIKSTVDDIFKSIKSEPPTFPEDNEPYLPANIHRR